MKKLTMLLVLALLMVTLSCTIKCRTNQNYILEEGKTVYIGEAMVEKKEICGYTEGEKVAFAAGGTVVEDEIFEQRLVYSGKTAKQIRVTYREFKNNMARSAFTQELIYEYPENKTIRFRSCQIEIIKADSQSITYRVLSDL